MAVTQDDKKWFSTLTIQEQRDVLSQIQDPLDKEKLASARQPNVIKIEPEIPQESPVVAERPPTTNIQQRGTGEFLSQSPPEKPSLGEKFSQLDTGKLIAEQVSKVPIVGPKLVKEMGQFTDATAAGALGNPLPKDSGPLDMIGYVQGMFTDPVQGSANTVGAGFKLGRTILNKVTRGKILPSATPSQIGKLVGYISRIGKSEKVGDIVAKNPELVFKPKRSWQTITTNIAKSFKQKKKVAGQAIGAGKDALKQLKPDTLEIAKVPTDEILAKVTALKNDSRFLTSTGFKAHVEEIDGLLKTGGKALKEGTKEGLRIGQGGVFEKTLRKVGDTKTRLDPNELDVIRTNIQTLVTGIQNSSAEGKAITSAESALLDLYSDVSKLYNQSLEQVDQLALTEGLTKSKGEYAKILRVQHTAKRIASAADAGNEFERSLMVNNEDLFDAMREILPPDLFEEGVAGALNARVSNISLGDMVQGVTKRAGATITGSPTNFPRRSFVPLAPQEAIRQTIGQGKPARSIGEGLVNLKERER